MNTPQPQGPLTKRLVPAKPETKVPEWLRRAREFGLPAKELPLS